MDWTYAQLLEADLALDPPVPDPGDAAEQLRRLPLTKTNQPFVWKQAKLIARESATGDWSRIVARSRMTAAMPPASVEDFAVLAAINAVESEPSDIIDPTDPGSWGAWQNGLAVLHAVGDLSQATLDKLNGLTIVITTRFANPPPDAGHVQTARAQAR